jgi:hypothetical protein
MEKYENIDELFQRLDRFKGKESKNVNKDRADEVFIPYEELNVCCPQSCMSCLTDAIEIVESGDWNNPGLTDPLTRCDRSNPSNTMHGHYQIGRAMIQDARSLCKGGSGLPRVPQCCDIPSNAYDILKSKCNGNEECCQNKKNLGQMIMACWRRRWTRNQGKGSCGWSKCDGSGEPSTNESGKHCFTCEDLAKMHKEGTCGHKCCSAPNCCAEVGDLQQAAEGGDACQRGNQYWSRVKSVMEQLCPNCEGNEIETEESAVFCNCIINGKGYDLTEEECINAGGQCQQFEVLDKEIATVKHSKAHTETETHDAKWYYRRCKELCLDNLLGGAGGAILSFPAWFMMQIYCSQACKDAGPGNIWPGGTILNPDTDIPPHVGACCYEQLIHEIVVDGKDRPLIVKEKVCGNTTLADCNDLSGSFKFAGDCGSGNPCDL